MHRRLKFNAKGSGLTYSDVILHICGVRAIAVRVCIGFIDIEEAPAIRQPYSLMLPGKGPSRMNFLVTSCAQIRVVLTAPHFSWLVTQRT